MSDDYFNFLKKYEAEATLDEGRRYAKRQPISFVSFDKYSPTYENYATEPYVKVYIPQHQFNELVRIDRYVEHLEVSADYNQSVVDMLRKDERVRDENPAVKKAYRNYLTLLELARI